MSNALNGNPLIIDTFDADFTIGGGLPITIKKVVLYSAADGDIFSLKSGTVDTGAEVLRLNQNSNLQAELDFGDNGFRFNHGLYFDANAINSGLGTNDIVLIYLI